MRKSLQFLVSAVLLLSLVGLSSCKKEEQASSIQFTATMEDCADVHNAKTVLNGNVLQWVAGDEIKIQSRVPAVFTATPLNPPTMATFTTTNPNFATDNEIYLAYYPAANSINWSRLRLPATQVSEDGSLRGFPMHAYSQGSTNLQFRNLCGVLKLNLQKTGVTVTSIALTMNDPINGMYTVTGQTTDQAELNSSPSSEGSNTTTLVCNQSINTVHDFYIYLPAGTYSGLTLEITTSDGRVCTKGPATGSVVIERSKYSTLTLGENDLEFRPIGSKGGLFSVSSTQQVWFSQGNLQYKTGGTGAGTWRFAPNQWSYVGRANNNIDYDSCTSWMDLFGWGTVSNPTIHLTDAIIAPGVEVEDWSSVAISNGGNTANSGWHALTSAEWDYLFNTRANASSKYGMGSVANIHGVILLPDDWTLPTGLTFSAGQNGWSSNSYNSADWALMEAAGAVFLPAAGFRWGTSIHFVGDNGFYWSSNSIPYSVDHAYNVSFGDGNLTTTGFEDINSGQAVRLVRNSN